MSFNWKDYVDLSEELLQGNKESCFRCSVSRAYYGVFCIARNKKGLAEIHYNVHQKVIEQYCESADIRERKIGQILSEMKMARVKADYQGGNPMNRGMAERAIIRAKEILTLMCVK